MKKIKNRWLIAACTVCVHLSIGAVYAYSVYKKPLLESKGWEPTQTAWAFSIAILFLGLSAAFLGPKVERIGPRKSGMISAVFYGLGLAVAGLGVQIGQLYVFYLGYGVIGGIGLGIGYICPVSSLVKWFPDRRGLATGLATMGFGFGALLASLLIQAFITRLGIPQTFYVLAAGYFVVMMLASQYLEPPPEGWLPDGYEDSLKSGKSRQVQDLAQLTSLEALGTVRFYLLWSMFFINITCGIAVISVASPMSQEIAGLTPAAAATMVGLMGIFNGLGRIGWASISDLIGRTMTYVVFFTLQIFAFLILPKTTGVIMFQVVVCLIVSCYGGGFAVTPAFIGDLFGTKRLSAILGNVLTAWAAAGLVGPLIAAKVRETTGSYEQTLQIFAGLFVFALVGAALIYVNIRKIRQLQLSQA
ncbi:L-lactate MFS transporter [Pelagicoccus albus]|uniref:OFA family MFS transporter n=1 Tax=Pelagicoccus albus TaxID=415222 RepID=A0A7X1B748_9BACT|nr:OFA family MFS transporter [Pelagicoccus albus]MBC2606752.1 OFA family MFS transporter [Pelagicoccus albus]